MDAGDGAGVAGQHFAASGGGEVLVGLGLVKVDDEVAVFLVEFGGFG